MIMPRLPLTVGPRRPCTTTGPVTWVPPVAGGVAPPSVSAEAAGAAAHRAAAASRDVVRRYPMLVVLGNDPSELDTPRWGIGQGRAPRDCASGRGPGRAPSAARPRPGRRPA